MAEITRDHLTLAALAAGHLAGGPDYWPQALERTLADGTDCYREWRPHLDDGDAFGLSVALLMYVDHRGTGATARVVGGDPVRVDHNGTIDDAARAAREAVTLCAAAVGERMREGGR
jgi:hypothetical protein